MPEPSAADPWRPAAVTAAGTLLVCTVLGTLAAAASDVSDGVAGTVRAGVRIWLVAVGSGLSVVGVRYTILPLGITLVVAAVAWALARWQTGAHPVADAGSFGAMAGGIAGIAAGITAAATSAGDTGTSFVRATFGAFVVVGLPAAAAASARVGQAWWGLPERWRPIAEAAATAVTGVLAAATVVTLVMLTAHLSQAADLWASLAPEGPLLLGLACVLSLPTLVLWTTAVLFGPGFALGSDTSVDLTGAGLGSVPGFPPLAGLPDPGPLPGWVVVLTLLPVAAGVAGGVVAWRGVPESDRSWGRVVGDGALAGAVAGVVVGLLAWTAGGSLGPGLLQTAGPSAWPVLAVAVPVLAAGAALGAAGAHYRSGRVRSTS